MIVAGLFLYISIALTAKVKAAPFKPPRAYGRITGDKPMQSRYIFDKVNQDITAAITRQVDRDSPTRAHAPTNDDLVCAIIFVVSVALLIFL